MTLKLQVSFFKNKDKIFLQLKCTRLYSETSKYVISKYLDFHCSRKCFKNRLILIHTLLFHFQWIWRETTSSFMGFERHLSIKWWYGMWIAFVATGFLAGKLACSAFSCNYFICAKFSLFTQCVNAIAGYSLRVLIYRRINVNKICSRCGALPWKNSYIYCATSYGVYVDRLPYMWRSRTMANEKNLSFNTVHNAKKIWCKHRMINSWKKCQGIVYKRSPESHVKRDHRKCLEVHIN